MFLWNFLIKKMYRKDLSISLSRFSCEANVKFESVQKFNVCFQFGKHCWRIAYKNNERQVIHNLNKHLQTNSLMVNINNNKCFRYHGEMFVESLEEAIKYLKKKKKRKKKKETPRKIRYYCCWEKRFWEEVHFIKSLVITYIFNMYSG